MPTMGQLIVWLVLTVLIIGILLKVIAKLTCGKYKIAGKLSPEMNVLITGATSGIGRAAALELARHGASVHLLCRDWKRANETRDSIEKETGNGLVRVWTVDLSSLQSVRTFARQFLATPTSVDVLINNAGIAWLQERTLTEDGLELTMATNHFGHFLLTHLLLDRIKSSKMPNPRIVVVSSIAHLFGNIDFNDINMEKNYSSNKAYANSKLANILFTKHLAHMLADTGITVNCLHPGAVTTSLYRSVSWLTKPFIPLLCLWFKSPLEAAESVLHLAVSEEVTKISGEYFWDCKKSLISRQARDEGVAKKLWHLSEWLTAST